jgi:hypothetical protein
MCQKPDQSFFKKLREMDPEDVCRRSLASLEQGGYLLPVLDDTVRVDPDACCIERVPGSPQQAHRQGASQQAYQEDAAPQDVPQQPALPVTTELGLMSLMYLLESRDLPLEGRWVNEYSLCGGAQFFRGPHAIPNVELAMHFGQRLDDFRSACGRLGGEPFDAGDAGFKFQVLPRIPVVVAFWYADEEFPASAKLLFDSTADRHLPLDVIYALSVELYRRISNPIK